MKLLCPELNEPISFNAESKLVELIIENKRTYAGVTKSLVGQIRDNMDNPWRLYDENKQESLSFCKSSALVLDPFSVDVNIHSVSNKINDELLSIANDGDNYMRTKAVQNELEIYAQQLLRKIPDGIEITYSADVSNVLKAMSFRVLLQYEDTLNSLYDYLCVLNDWGGIKLTIFVGLRSFLDDEDMHSLTEMLNYKGIKALSIENREQPKIQGLRRILIDAHHCVIA